LQVEAESTSLPASRRRSRSPWLRAAVVGGASLLLVFGIGVAFAGSPDLIAPGIKIAGVDVGDRSVSEARQLLAQRSQGLSATPVLFLVGGHRFAVKPNELGIKVDWASAVAKAQRDGSGLAPFRGFKRLVLRLRGENVTPSITVWSSALDYELGRMAKAVDRPATPARLVLHGLRPVVLPAASGVRLDTKAAGDMIARALASFERGQPVVLPVVTAAPSVTAAALQPAAAKARLVVSAPVRLRLGPARWLIPRRQLAKLLQLPEQAGQPLAIGGPQADRYFARFQRTVEHAPADATFAVSGSHVRIVPGVPGLALDVPATADALLAAALRPLHRTARVVVGTAQPTRTTADARAMGIIGLVSSYETFFGGVPNRIHNVELVARLIDDKLIAPGATFSFNQTTGDRTAAKGFLTAPVIINGELSTGLGGGVCQVSTTVFNAAFEAGLGITARTNHALYISHYPLGRDATVNYPDVDLRFVNDTPHWLLLRTFVTSSSLVVNLYGTPVHRRVVSTATPLVATGPVPVKKTPDPTLAKGKTVVDQTGTPPLATSVHRIVYAPNGKVLHDDTWHSSYVAQPTLERIGTKKPAKKPQPAATTPGTTTPAGPNGPVPPPLSPPQ
jgi:vancomycin resistance protein YoaR